MYITAKAWPAEKHGCEWIFFGYECVGSKKEFPLTIGYLYDKDGRRFVMLINRSHGRKARVMETIQAFVAANPVIMEEIEQRASDGQSSIGVDDIIAIADAHGIDHSNVMTGQAKGELSDDELLAVTGGAQVKLCAGFGLVLNF